MLDIKNNNNNNNNDGTLDSKYIHNSWRAWLINKRDIHTGAQF